MRRDKPKRAGGVIFLSLVGVMVAAVLTKWLVPGSNLQIAQLKSSFNLESYFKFDFESAKIKEIVTSNLKDTSGQFGVVVEDLRDQERYALNGGESFPSASLYKLILMAAVLKEVEEGSIGLKDNLSADQSYLSETLGSQDFGYDTELKTVSMTIEQALDRIARVSDNYAAIMLADKLKDRAKLKNMAKELEMNSTNFETELIQTTPLDIATFFKKLYAGEVVSKSVSDSLTTLLLKAQLNNRIPAKLPKTVRVAHKTGELPRVKHDAGIVFLSPPDSPKNATAEAILPTQAYIIVLMSKDLKFEDDAIKVFSQLSKDVYDYLSQKKP